MISNVSIWIDEIVKKFPNKIGVVDEKGSYSFIQIRENALKIATAIVNKGLFKAPVVVYMEKGVDSLISFYAIAYSGNFYTPIDVKMPVERINKICQILNPKLIVTKRAQKNKVENLFPDIEYVCIDELVLIDEACVLQQRNKCCDSDLLYVLFTSGSTGVPKGVSISHRAMVDFIDSFERTFNITQYITLGNQAPFWFDLSIPDVYLPIKTGATTYVIPTELFSWPIRLLQYIKDKKINSIVWAPSALVLVSKLKALLKVDLNNCLENVFFCGEVMPNRHLNVWRKYIPNAMYCNMYGPTEITFACTYYIVNKIFLDEESLPIGIPMDNTDIIVLNDENKLVKCGEIGELCVRGSSLSSGYYNSPEKTREVFVQNPLNKSYVELVYRTGDLVKYNEIGELIYISRKDHQIKHMGHRIELGEIEAAVSTIKEISVNCCLYDEVRQKIVLFIEGHMELNEINAILRNIIPEYMLPGRVVEIEEIPLNQNGKIDRIKLKELL